MKNKCTFLAALSLLAVGGMMSSVVSAPEESAIKAQAAEQVVIDVLASGQGGQKTSIEGAGAFVFLSVSDIPGLSPTTFSTLTATATLDKALNANGDPAPGMTSARFETFNRWDWANDTFCAYVILSRAPEAGWETTFTVTLTFNEIEYVAVAEYIGFDWAYAEPDPEIPEDQIKYIDVAPSNGSRDTSIQGAGAFIYLNASDIVGLDATNWPTATVIGKMEESLNPGGAPTGWAITRAQLEQFGNGYICAYTVFNGAPIEGYKTTISVTITFDGSYYRAIANFDGQVLVVPASETAQQFIDDWAIMRLEGGESGICTFINTAAMNDLLARYDALNETDKAKVDSTTDGDCTIGESIAYVKTLTNEMEESIPEKLSVNVEGQSTNLTLIVIIAVCALSAVGAYTFISKKRS